MVLCRRSRWQVAPTSTAEGASSDSDLTQKNDSDVGPGRFVAGGPAGGWLLIPASVSFLRYYSSSAGRGHQSNLEGERNRKTPVCISFLRGAGGHQSKLEGEEFYNQTLSLTTEEKETGLARRKREFLKYKPLSQHTGTTRARTGADWHTHRLTTGAA